MIATTSLHRQYEQHLTNQVPASPSSLGFCVIYYNPSRCEIRCKSSDWAVNLQLQKHSTSDPFKGLDWKISCGASSNATMRVSKQLFARDTVFQDADGNILTIMAQGLFSDYAEFAWGPFIYRWTRIRGTKPLKLQLHNVNTQERVACLEGCLSVPSNTARHDYITLMTSSRDIRWLQLIIASGMAEANCLGSEHFGKR